MLVNITSVSLRNDELEGIKAFMEKYPTFKTKHQVIKFAISRVIFPEKTKDIDVDGESVSMHPPIESGHLHVPQHIWGTEDQMRKEGLVE